ncbi:MAG: hypothetical protein H7Y01_06020, partial [Ferruginibacter sp.]|nr:hypothetical protein [Chitinophagaceae bacterium]
MQLRIPVALLTIILFLSCNDRSQTESNFPSEEMDGMEEAMRQEFLMTRDPALNIIPNERLVSAKDFMESLVTASNTARTTALGWQERGPSNIGGRTRGMLIDKRDATGNTVFAGSVSGGLFKTTNFVTGSPVVWSVVNDFFPNLAIASMAQGNVNQNVMYAGTGEGWFNFEAVRGRGIYKST